MTAPAPDIQALREVAERRLAGCERDARRFAKSSGDYEQERADQIEFATCTVPLAPFLALLSRIETAEAEVARKDAALRELSDAIKDVAPHFDAPAVDHLEKWKRLDRAQKSAAAALKDTPNDR